MAQTKQIILMADVISSRTFDGAALSAHLLEATEAANFEFKRELGSPLTVTLGDEFQGVCASVRVGVDLMLWLERHLRKKPHFEKKKLASYQLRYVLHEGVVESPLNPDRAHGMLGPGLTRARELLDEHRRGAPRFRVVLDDADRSRRLTQLFQVLDAIASDYKADDFAFIEALLDESDNERVGEQFDRHRTSVDRRRRTLKIEAYQLLERLLRDLAVN